MINFSYHLYQSISVRSERYISNQVSIENKYCNSDVFYNKQQIKMLTEIFIGNSEIDSVYEWRILRVLFQLNLKYFRLLC